MRTFPRICCCFAHFKWLVIFTYLPLCAVNEPKVNCNWQFDFQMENYDFIQFQMLNWQWRTIDLNNRKSKVQIKCTLSFVNMGTNSTTTIIVCVNVYVYLLDGWMFMLMPFVLLYVCIKIYTSALSGIAATAAAAAAQPSMSIWLFALRVLCSLVWCCRWLW